MSGTPFNRACKALKGKVGVNSNGEHMLCINTPAGPTQVYLVGACIDADGIIEAVISKSPTHEGGIQIVLLPVLQRVSFPLSTE